MNRLFEHALMGMLLAAGLAGPSRADLTLSVGSPNPTVSPGQTTEIDVFASPSPSNAAVAVSGYDLTFQLTPAGGPGTATVSFVTPGYGPGNPSPYAPGGSYIFQGNSLNVQGPTDYPGSPLSVLGSTPIAPNTAIDLVDFTNDGSDVSVAGKVLVAALYVQAQVPKNSTLSGPVAFDLSLITNHSLTSYLMDNEGDIYVPAFSTTLDVNAGSGSTATPEPSSFLIVLVVGPLGVLGVRRSARKSAAAIR